MQFTLRCLYCGHIYTVNAEDDHALLQRLRTTRSCGKGMHPTHPNAAHHFEIIKPK